MPLDRNVILSAAFKVLSDGGLDSLTLRRLASLLHVQAPAIYWHFKNKRDLLDEMGTYVLREAMTNLPSIGDWRDWLRAYCQGLRRTLLSYRDGAKMVSGTYLTDPILFGGMEASLRVLTQAGLTLRQSVVGLNTAYSYVIGFVIEEQALESSPGEPDTRYSLTSRDRRVDKEKYPLAFAAGREMFTGQDRRFAEGAELLIAGINTMLTAESRGV